MVLVLVGSLVKRLLLLLGKLVVDGVVSGILLSLLQVLKLGLPDTAESLSGVLGNLSPGRLCAEELDVVGLGGESLSADTRLAGEAANVAKVVLSATEDVLGDEGLGVEDWSKLVDVVEGRR